MRLFKMMKSKRIGIFIASLLAAVFLAPGLLSVQASAETAPASEIIYIDTEVETIIYAQHPTCVFFGFYLTESDYDDFGTWEGDFGGTAVYTRYEEYIALDLRYWRNFSEMNSEGVILDQLYAYWNGSSVGPARFVNTVAHRSTLERLEYGFVISIPAGTTFPSAPYVKGNCEGSPIMYRTTKDVAFYFNGTDFEIFHYEVAKQRMDAVEEVNDVNFSLYHDAERQEVIQLIINAEAKLQNCFTGFAVQDVLSSFYADLDKIMTKADYKELASKKETAKTELATFFNNLSEENYEAAEWNAILALKNEYSDLIDSVAKFDEVNAAVISVKYAVEKVMTKEDKAGFAQYRTDAVTRFKNSFDSSLYRDAERAQGEALLAEGSQAIESATTYEAVDALEALYTSRLGELKTASQWEEEENNAAKDDVFVDPKPNHGYGSSAKNSCFGIVGETQVVFGVAVLAAAAIIKKKERKGTKDEN